MKEEDLKKLYLDPSRITRDLDVHEQLAEAYEAALEERRDDVAENALYVSATNFRRAAAHSLLLDDVSRPRTLFSRAAGAHDRLESPYALMLRTFTTDAPDYGPYVQYQRRDEQEERPSRYLPHQSIYVLLVHATTRDGTDTKSRDSGHMQEIREDLEAHRSHPVGTLGLPLGSYLDLADHFRNDLSRTGSLEHSLLPLIKGYDSAVRQALQDRYHWSRLALPFHPAEPDVFSALLLVQSAVTRKNQSLMKALDGLPLAPETHLLLKGILGLYS